MYVVGRTRAADELNQAALNFSTGHIQCEEEERHSPVPSAREKKKECAPPALSLGGEVARSAVGVGVRAAALCARGGSLDSRVVAFRVLHRQSVRK